MQTGIAFTLIAAAVAYAVASRLAQNKKKQAAVSENRAQVEAKLNSMVTPTCCRRDAEAAFFSYENVFLFQRKDFAQGFVQKNAAAISKVNGAPL